MYEKQPTTNWLMYLGACDALVDNWGEYLDSAMWCSPQLLDISQVEIVEKPKHEASDDQIVRSTVERSRSLEAAQESPEQNQP